MKSVLTMGKSLKQMQTGKELERMVAHKTERRR